MKNEERFIVGGYLFGDDNDVKQAKEEEETIVFLESKVNFDDAETTLRIYEKAVKEKIFKTPIGFEFLRKVQEELKKRGVPEENILPVSLYQVYSRKEEVKPVRKKKVKIKPDKTKIYLHGSLWINVLLVIVVVGMFIISFFGETPNIVNYRHKIQDEYSTWEQELTERESRIKEKEQELNLE